jgi:hypothetical protein
MFVKQSTDAYHLLGRSEQNAEKGTSMTDTERNCEHDWREEKDMLGDTCGYFACLKCGKRRS